MRLRKIAPIAKPYMGVSVRCLLTAIMIVVDAVVTIMNAFFETMIDQITIIYQLGP